MLRIKPFDEIWCLFFASVAFWYRQRRLLALSLHYLFFRWNVYFRRLDRIEVDSSSVLVCVAILTVLQKDLELVILIIDVLDG